MGKKHDELIRKYEHGEISESRLFKEQDDLMAQHLFIGCGVFFVAVAVVAVVTFVLWIGG